jgi:CheY-like chemotaxis protein
MTAVDLPAVPRVLIAEADPWSRDLLKQVLLNVRCDARLDVCADGQQAATLLQEKAYDLILADWELPGIDGLSLLRNVRQKRRSPALPFILLSTRNDSASVREALPLAPTAYLTKPLDMDGLTQRLQDLLLNEGEIDELATFNVGHGGVLCRLGEDRVNLANTAWYSGFAAFHQGCVGLAHKVLIRHSSGGGVQGIRGGEATTAACDDRLPQLSRPLRITS